MLISWASQPKLYCTPKKKMGSKLYGNQTPHPPPHQLYPAEKEVSMTGEMSLAAVRMARSAS